LDTTGSGWYRKTPGLDLIESTGSGFLEKMMDKPCEHVWMGVTVRHPTVPFAVILNEHYECIKCLATKTTEETPVTKINVKPNAETVSAMEEARSGGLAGFDSAQELFDDLERE
jgi:hypothetical protein